MFNGVLNKKEVFLGYENVSFLSLQNCIFPKGLTMILVKKLEFFLYLFLVKIRLEITVTDDLEKIEAFTDF